jgi:hypothetical protein
LIQRSGAKLKIGHSKQPTARAYSIHQNWEEYFDTENSFAIEVDSVRRSRWLELGLQLSVESFSVESPYPEVSWGGGGHSEWYDTKCLTLLQSEVGRLLSCTGVIRVHRPFTVLTPEDPVIVFCRELYNSMTSDEVDRFLGLEPAASDNDES